MTRYSFYRILTDYKAGRTLETNYEYAKERADELTEKYKVGVYVMAEGVKDPVYGTSRSGG